MAFLLDQLSLLGLNEREVRVFVALATFGRMNMTRVAQRAGLSRTTVDAIVRRLTVQGLVHCTKIGGHLEYSVPLNHLADTLTSVSARLRTDPSEEPQQDRDEMAVDALPGHTITPAQLSSTLDREFERHAGERARILLRGVRGDAGTRAQVVFGVLVRAVQWRVKLEALLCTHTADALRSSAPHTAADLSQVLLNIVPSSYCATEWDVLVFRDTVLTYNEHAVRVLTQTTDVEVISHLLTIACETGWSVRLGAWSAHSEAGHTARHPL